MTTTRAFDLAQWVGTPANIGDGIVITGLGPPFTEGFAPLVQGGAPGVTVGASVPAASGAGQSLVSGGSSPFPWQAVPSATAFPSPNAQGQILVSGPGPGYAWGLQAQFIASATLPLMDGTPTAGAAGAWARGDHVHPTDTSRYAATNPSGFQTAAQVSAAITAAAYVLPIATTSVLGGVKADGSTILVSGAGVLSVSGSVGIAEAPNDGTSYLRNSGAWVNGIDAGTF